MMVSGSDPERVCLLLQHDLDAVSTWCMRNKLTTNTDKTKVLWSHSPNNKPPVDDLPLNMAGRVLEVVTNVNYLGVTIDSTLSFKSQCKKIVNLTQVRLNQLRDVRKHTDAETTALVYVQMVRPIMEYCPFVVDGGPTNVQTE